uniref:Uncharacterized protein n=1 Tax=Tanacetum cinerariifolium TaxID=118510 RepID=A0A6L2P0G8_TANCI|nr:hypothetical protein [Tanacetum cinerariifolium]
MIFADLSSHTTKYTSPALTQKVFTNMRRVGKGFSGVDTSLFEGMLVPQQVHVDIDAAKPTPPTLAPTPPPPPQELIPSSSQVTPTPPPSPHHSPIAQPSSPPQQPPLQPSQTTDISMDLLNTMLETYTTLTRKVENLEQDKIAQALEITKLKRMHPNRRKIAELDADEDVTLEEVPAEVTKDADVQGRLEESQAQVYHLDLEHAQKVLKVVTAAATTITAAPMPMASALKRRKGVVIRDPEETATPSVIVYYEPKSKDKGKGILVENPKPLKKQAHIEQDKAYARELKAELNANINWNEVIEQVKRKEKQDNIVMRYQALKRKPQTEAQARKNMMVYLKNMDGFKMDFFKGMTYDEIRPIFEKHFNSIVAFLEKGEKKLQEEASKQSKRKIDTSKEKTTKKQKLDEEVEELRTHLQIIPNNEDDVYTKATPLALKVPVIDYQIHTEHNKPYYKIIRADGTHQLFLSFISLLRNFDREDLEMLWKIFQERFASSEPKNFSYDFLLNTLKTMFEKPNVEAHIWRNQRGIYRFAKVKS